MIAFGGVEIVLAQSASSRNAGELFNSILPWLGVLALVVVVGGVVLTVIRRSMRSETGSKEVFSLQTLRELRASGELTEEQYEKARLAIIGKAGGASDKKSAGLPETREPPRRIDA
jgi:uncharacterized membrane protein